MKTSDFDIGDYFITSALPVERAFRYGILCVSKDEQKVVFERYSNGEELSIFVKDGEAGMGNWVKTYLTGKDQVDAVVLVLDRRENAEESIRWQIESGMKDLVSNTKATNEVLTAAIERK